MPLLMCPNCNVSMQAVRRNQVEFDMCPSCRGVWLDRGELEKLMAMGRENEAREHRNEPSYVRPDERYSHGGKGYTHHDPRKRHKRFDLFDIFD